ncbi:MAG: ornithine carbamoyltransferase [Treponemataceae bacterium]|nr:MAG: ornithine carbamoyltransferase [Treponemataceae bacterium]
MTLYGRSLLTWLDYTPAEITFLLELAHTVKREKNAGEIRQRLVGKTIALIFEKRSTRTRSAFETAVGEEGGHPVFLSTADIQLGAKESVEDTARVLGRMYSAIQYRGFSQKTAETLAEFSGVPVYNGLTDSFHPTQALADVMTLQEEFGFDGIAGKNLVFCGDGRNNVARSLMVICAKLGINCTIIAPKELFPDSQIVKICSELTEKSESKNKSAKAQIRISETMRDVQNADCVYTDVWTSMGEEALKNERNRLLTPYQVNENVMAQVNNAKCVFLHCLPAVQNEEVTTGVIESAQSRVWDQAENRKHTVKAILLATLLKM